MSIVAGERVTVTPLRHGRRMPDDHSPEKLEQLARSLAMTSAMTDSDRLTVVELLRQFARQAHPTARQMP